MTQCDQLRRHLDRGDTITSLEAVEQYGITRLAARIYDLRREGMPIDDRFITVTNRHGEEVEVKEYFLEGAR